MIEVVVTSPNLSGGSGKHCAVAFAKCSLPGFTYNHESKANKKKKKWRKKKEERKGRRKEREEKGRKEGKEGEREKEGRGKGRRMGREGKEESREEEGKEGRQHRRGKEQGVSSCTLKVGHEQTTQSN